MREEFKKAFSDLDLSDKRNELNNEMEVAFRVLQTIKENIGYNDTDEETIRNYDVVKDANLNESELLDLLYCDFYLIQKNIIDIADFLINKSNNNSTRNRKW